MLHGHLSDSSAKVGNEKENKRLAREFTYTLVEKNTLKI